MSALFFGRIAAIAVLVTALGLAGCGRKGGLDLPPGATPAETSMSRPDLEPAIAPTAGSLRRRKDRSGVRPSIFCSTERAQLPIGWPDPLLRATWSSNVHRRPSGEWKNGK